jgi:TolB protein
VSDRGGNRDVYRLAPDQAGEPVRVTTGLDAQTITLSPDGTRLAYNRLQSTINLWTMPVPTAGVATAQAAVPVTSGNQTIENVDVSRDGRWLVFDSDRNGNADLYKLPVTGGEPVQLTTDPAGDFRPRWSPDGTRIAFHSLRTGNRDLFTINADGTGLTRWTSDRRHELDPSWAPDGTAIVVETIDSAWTAGNFIVVPVTGPDTAPRLLEGIGDFAEWSPTGDVIAYHTADGIGLLDPAGGPPRLLVANAADGTEAFYAAWAPDGRTLYYLARSGQGWMIRAIPRTGGRSRIVVRFDDPARQPAAYGFATDGRRFYFTLGSHEADAWVLDLETR